MKESVQAATTETEQQKLEILRGFFDGYAQRNKDSNEALRLVTPFVEKFEIELPALKDKERIWETTVAPHFNVFQVLRIERKEQKLHSRFIAALLDPNGLHSQGKLFLNLFLGVAREATQGCRFRGPGLFAADSLWQVTTEEAVDQSDRLDIVLRCPSRNYLMVIENKVDAREQDQQLSRYSSWLERQKEKHPNTDKIFLTPEGKPPEEIKSRDDWVCLSYNEDIATWLTRALQDLKPPSLCLAIEQYIKIVETL